MYKIINLLSPYRFISQDTLEHGYLKNGFADRSSALYWRDRACGIACLQMLLFARYQKYMPAGALIDAATAHDAYRAGIGWIHRGLAALLQEYGVSAEAKLLNRESLMHHLTCGGTAVLSVNPTLGARTAPPEDRAKRGGHLVLCHGFSALDDDKDQLSVSEEVLISDPDHEFPDRLEGELASLQQVDRAWSGRCVSVAPLGKQSR